ncbi:MULTISPECIES: hypothetical protein [Proteus]|jgi:hypothetical protein|uniref:Uncharacterized protein n=2 Tax=Proteus vulgaris TaxID=585 RepID=A0A379F495_PROVU|nr:MULTISPECIES: hypothetical protein [Proteus]WOO48656.1 hypothetical protein R2S03_14355 [Hafnia alvei]MCW4527074.1 hypothetical protein [Proteus mirabilis]WPF03120.1 hypothetical protein SB028_13190 [Proteus vulgaris]SUB99898.1 Uncharacterised protein [Proteus penneri]SUC14449.1 Uncharacterised protein [Proteus vulgaris]
MKINQDIFRLAQAQAQVAIRQKCEDIWWLAMELLKESYQEGLCK